MWANDTVQFARLISELAAAGAFTEDVLADLCASMDLEPQHIVELRHRAQRLWEHAQQRSTATDRTEQTPPRPQERGLLVTPTTGTEPITPREMTT